MKRNYAIAVFILILGLIAGGVYFRFSEKNNSLPAPVGQPGGQTPDQAQADPFQPTAPVNMTGLPLNLPSGFAIETFAKNLPGARVMALDGFGNMWLSQTRQGIITRLDIQDGKVIAQNAVLKNLNNPHGLAIDGNILYFAEEDKISRVTLYSDDFPKKIADLPSGGGHYTRTLGFGPDGKLYVSIGSSCNVCSEKDERRAAIYSMNKDGSDFKSYATGLRNSVFFQWSFVDGKMWATEMGRDNLGDNLPPEEINIIEDGKDYGWPICYGQNIHDTNFDKNNYIQNPCVGKMAPKVELPAHSAPLGLAFVPEGSSLGGWPEDYWHDLLVAFHGSWNSSNPVGYKIVRVKLDARGNYQGTEDFLTGFLPSGSRNGPREALGRPVDIVAQPGGIIFVSDDKAGAVYKIRYMGKSISLSSSSSSILSVNIKDNQIVASPMTVQGEAKGNWFFEASFPVKLVDANWVEIARGVAQANPPAGGDWMTMDFVPFSASLTFKKPGTATGWLVIERDNPSGLVEHAAEVHIPVRFE